MSSDRGKLGDFLAEVIHWRWDEFCEAEKDPKYTGLQAAVFKLVRTCSDGKLGAIRLAIDRVDGKIETPIKIEYPRVWFLYPDAENVALPRNAAGETPPQLSPEDTYSIARLAEADIPEEEPVSAATLTLRETLQKMADHSRQLPLLIHEKKKQVERGETTVEENIPLVKSVIAANLLILANEKGSFEAITEVFDQIDGKLVETIRILGDDIYLTQYTLEAPYGATKNKDGIYMLEAKEIAASWREKLKKN